MCQAAYIPEPWAAQVKSPKSRVEAFGQRFCEAARGQTCWWAVVALVIFADVPDNNSMPAIALAVAAVAPSKPARRPYC
jgi:hypothetical protein